LRQDWVAVPCQCRWTQPIKGADGQCKKKESPDEKYGQLAASELGKRSNLKIRPSDLPKSSHKKRQGEAFENQKAKTKSDLMAAF